MITAEDNNGNANEQIEELITRESFACQKEHHFIFFQEIAEQ